MSPIDFNQLPQQDWGTLPYFPTPPPDVGTSPYFPDTPPESKLRPGQTGPWMPPGIPDPPSTGGFFGGPTATLPGTIGGGQNVGTIAGPQFPGGFEGRERRIDKTIGGVRPSGQVPPSGIVPSVTPTGYVEPPPIPPTGTRIKPPIIEPPPPPVDPNEIGPPDAMIDPRESQGFPIDPETPKGLGNDLFPPPPPVTPPPIQPPPVAPPPAQPPPTTTPAAPAALTAPTAPSMGTSGEITGPSPQTGGVYTGSPYGFQYPQEWDTASNVLTEFARGIPQTIPWQWQEGSDIASQMAQGVQGETPWQWEQGSDLARQMAETGMPTSYQDWYVQAKKIAERDTQKAINQAAEQAGMSGLRYSTPMGQTAQRISGEYMQNLGLAFTEQEMGSLEAARARQLQGSQQLQQFGTGQAAIEEAGRQRQLQGSQQLQQFGYGITGLEQAEQERGLRAASMLPGLGAQYLQAPQDWAAQTYGMGAGMTQLGQTALDRYYQDYMRMTPEQNPWVNQAMSYWGTPSQMGYQQYQPSTMSQVLGGAGSIGSMAIGLC